MAFTYDPDNLTDSVNKVRLLIGDVDSEDPQFADEEIQAFINSTSTDQAAAALALNALAARTAGLVDKWVGDLKLLESQKHRAYAEQAAVLLTGGRMLGIPSAGGIRVSQKESQEADSDLVVPSFRRNQFDYSGEPQ